MSQSGGRDHDETSAGWDEGHYARTEQKKEERKWMIIVAAIALLVVCAFVCVAVGAYYYV